MSRSPSREDSLARLATTWLGGPVGLRARVGVSRWTPLVVLILVTTATFAVGLAQKGPCHEAGWPADRQLSYDNLCYSDIPYLFRERGFAEGNVAYLDQGNYPALEYPVLTGLVMQVTATVSRTVGGGDAVTGSVLFFDLTLLTLFVFALVTIGILSRIHPERPYDAMLVAAAPALALAGTINWDLLAVALSTAALFAWSRHRPGLTGILLGLGAAAKFYPLLLLGPLLLLAVRTGRLRTWFSVLLAASAAWLAVNLPLILLAPGSWQTFWTFNQAREADFGSIWYVLGLAGRPIEHVNLASAGLFALACLGIAALALKVPTRPRLGQLAFLTVAAFLLVNKVYSPQYVLWLLPLIALARPHWRDWAIWQAAEVFYWLTIWLHLGQHLFPPVADAQDRLYWFAVLVRMAATGYLCAVVIRDIVVPAEDVVRDERTVGDPIGGPFEQAPGAHRPRRPRGPVRPSIHEGAMT